MGKFLVETHHSGPTGKMELYFDDKKATFLSLEKGDFGGGENAAADNGAEVF